MNWKTEKESRPSRLRHCLDRLEYRKESWRPEEICCPSESSERLLANAGVKNVGVKNAEVKDTKRLK